MRNFITAFIAAMFLMCAGSGRLAANDVDEIQHLFNRVNNIHFIWQQRDFATLETWAREYREKKTPTQDGGWHIATFYHGFGQSFNERSSLERTRAVWNEVYKEWQKAYPQSPTPHIAHATTLLSEAWALRGGRYSHEVWSEDRTAHIERLRTAKEVLKKHKAIASHDQYYYAVSGDIGVALSETSKEFFGRLDEGIKRYPFYTGYYSRGARYLSPKWGGSAEAFSAWADYAVNQTRSTEGLSIYADLYRDFMHDDFAKDLLATSPKHREKIKQGIADMLQRHLTLSNLQTYRSLACALREPEEIEKLYAAARRLDPQSISPTPRSAAEFCSWPKEPVADLSVVAPPVPGAIPGVQKARTP